MFIVGPQRGLFVGCLGLGLGSLLLLDLHFAPAAIAKDDALVHGGDASTTPVTPGHGSAPTPSVRVVIDPASRVPTIVARFGTESKEPADQSAIRALATAMIEDHDSRIVLEGHSDTQGGKDYNHDLSLERATWVKSRLVALGVSPDRIETVGLGSTRPLRGADDGQAVNRRVEVRWLNQPRESPPEPTTPPKRERDRDRERERERERERGRGKKDAGPEAGGAAAAHLKDAGGTAAPENQPTNTTPSDAGQAPPTE